MEMLLFIVNSVALGIGLAMDAFSVSITNGLREPGMKRKRMLFISGTYAFFQFIMPVTGWFLVRRATDVFSFLEPAIPWTALILLSVIGGKMFAEGIAQIIRDRNKAEAGEDKDTEEGAEGFKPVSLPELAGQGVATAIDALSVGLTTEKYSLPAAFGSALIIAAVTWVICMAGLKLGKVFGMKLAHRGAVVGGAILVGIGVEIFVRGVFL